MSQEIKNIGTRDLRHTKAFEFWRINNQNIQATAEEFKKSRQTIYNWIQSEDWEAHAVRFNALEAEKAVDNAAKQSREHLTDGTKAIETSRRNHGLFQQCVELLAKVAHQLIAKAHQEGRVQTAEDFALLFRSAGLDILGDLALKDANIAAKLYPSLIPQRLEIGEVRSPAELMLLDQASQAEFSQLTEPEARA